MTTPPKKGLKTRPSNNNNLDMNITILPKNGLKTRPYSKDMEKKDLKKLNKGQLIKLLMNQRKKPTPPPRTGKWERVKPKPVPRKRVNEDTILPPPEQFQDGYKPIPKPRTDRPLPPTPRHEFDFDDDILQTGNQSLEKFKIISVQSRENKKFKSYTNKFKVKILKKLDGIKRYITYSKN